MLRKAVTLTGTDESRSNYQIRRAYVDLGRILVDAAHAVTEVGEAGPGNEPDITGSDHRDSHDYSWR